MNEPIAPNSLEELQRFVSATPTVLPVGNLTKPALAATGATPVSLRGLSGLVEYEPSEFTFTALAGTRVAEIVEVLTAQNQYLPFDPPLVAAGCTLGGVVAAGISGPGRVRYGGIRDFFLGARLISGEGELLTVGGKVVKNAAGFDIPKLLVGSLGRLGILTELTFKVFPAPPATLTFRVTCANTDQAIERIAAAARSRWEVDAVEYLPRDRSVYLRLAGPEPVLESLSRCVVSTWNVDVARLEASESQAFWDSLAAWERLPAATVLVKVPSTLAQFRSLHKTCSAVDGLELRLGGAGSVTWIRCEHPGLLNELHRLLVDQQLPGMVVHASPDHVGSIRRFWLGPQLDDHIGAAIKRAMDPFGKFSERPGVVSDALSSESMESSAD